jgi:hypothetical protein
METWMYVIVVVHQLGIYYAYSNVPNLLLMYY